MKAVSIKTASVNTRPNKWSFTRGVSALNILLRSETLLNLTMLCFISGLTAAPALAHSGSVADAEMTQKEIFAARIPTAKIFPECGIQGSRACEYDLVVIGRGNLGDPLESARGSYEKFRILPAPLLGSVIFDLIKGSDECPSEKLAVELSVAQEKSFALGDEPLATTSSKEISGCFGMITSAGEPTSRTILIWRAGKIYGWVDCSDDPGYLVVCSLQLYPPIKSVLGDRTTSFALDISGVTSEALEQLLLNADRVEGRIHEFMSKTIDLTLNPTLPSGVFHWDEATKSFLGDIGTR